MGRMKLRELINLLEELSNNGKSDEKIIYVRIIGEEYLRDIEFVCTTCHDNGNSTFEIVIEE